MLKNKTMALALAALAIVATITNAQDTAPKTPATGTNSLAAKPAAKQADSASKTASFAKIAATDDVCKTALDAHALDAALKQVGKDGAFKGKVTQIFEPRNGSMAIVNFDPDYKTALTALLWKTNFAKFPALTNLAGKYVVVTGKFIEYQGRAEIVLTNATQVKLVE